MLRSVNEIINYVLEAKDGEIGRCKDFLFDETNWVVRYMVADTGKWLPKRKVLLSPISLGQPEWTSGRFPVNLSREQIENAPSLAAEKPVSRIYEEQFMDYYGYPYYWVGDALWAHEPYAHRLFGVSKQKAQNIRQMENKDNHLRSVKEIKGYGIRAIDGSIGHVQDCIVEDDSWVLRYVVVDTLNILPGGKKVLISPEWTEEIYWAGQSIQVGLTRDQVKNSPEYQPDAPINREYETVLYDFYGKPHYWL